MVGTGGGGGSIQMQGGAARGKLLTVSCSFVGLWEDILLASLAT